MTTAIDPAMVSAFYDVGDVIYQNQRNHQLNLKSQMAVDRRIVGAPIVTTSAANMTRNRNYSTGSTSNSTPFMLSSGDHSISPATNTLISAFDTFTTATRETRKLDRSLSDPIDKSVARNVNSSRYKTELCRPFEESGHCKYGDKCQFAHGGHELKNLSRHPKYKTDLCRTYHTIGFCPYGPRCHFVHNEEERNLSIAQQNTVNAALLNQRSRAMKCETSSLGSVSDTSPLSSVTDSPTMSPTLFAEDFILSTATSSHHNNLPSTSCPFGQQQQISGSSALPASSHLMTSSNNNNSVFSFTAADLPLAASVTTPLNVYTQQTNSTTTNYIPSENSLNQQIDYASIYNRRNDCQSVFTSDSDLFIAPPTPSPPESVSGDSLSSSGYSTCGSPLDVSKSLRLPIFSRLSLDDSN